MGLVTGPRESVKQAWFPWNAALNVPKAPPASNPPLLRFDKGREMRRRLQWAAMIHLTSKKMLKPHRCTTLSLHLLDAPGWISGAQDLSFSVYSPSFNCVGSSHLQTKSLVLIRLHSLGESISVFTFMAVTQSLMVFCSTRFLEL